MTIRSKTSVIAAALLPLLAVPAIGHANENQAFDSCVKAFVGETLEENRPVVVRRAETAVSPVARFPRTYKILLTAVGRESGKQLAAGTCITDRNGVVLSLNGKPASATPALADATSAR